MRKDTLAYQLSRPATSKLNLGAVPFGVVANKATMFLNSFVTYISSSPVSGYLNSLGGFPPETQKGHPERDAVMFYMLNHAVSIVRSRVHELEPLGKYLPILTQYHQDLTFRATRMAFYLLFICTRESRHEHNHFASSSSWLSDLDTTQRNELIKFHVLIKSDPLGSLANSPPKVDLGTYAKFLSRVFYDGDYSGGYGGKKWGKVADAYLRYVTGETSAEGMMDTAFTLAHNNGPIFNKGMLYESYSSKLIDLLDIQAAGGIPTAVYEGVVSHNSDPQVQKAFNMCYALLGDEFIASNGKSKKSVESEEEPSEFGTMYSKGKLVPPIESNKSQIFPGFKVEKAERNK